MTAALKCRLVEFGETCGLDAAVGLLTENLIEHATLGDGSPSPILELMPLCEHHAPDEIHEMSVTSSPEDWAVITLAYGASGGDLR